MKKHTKNQQQQQEEEQEHDHNKLEEMRNNKHETGYKRVLGATRSCNNSFRGFRLNIRKLSIQRLRTRFIHFFRVLFKWRKSYDRAVKSFKKGISCGGSTRNCTTYSNNNTTTTNNNGSNNRLISEDRRKPDCRLRSLCRSNSFYTEAIADCLEFIKRNSYSAHENEAAPIVAHLR